MEQQEGVAPPVPPAPAPPVQPKPSVLAARVRRTVKSTMMTTLKEVAGYDLGGKKRDDAEVMRRVIIEAGYAVSNEGNVTLGEKRKLETLDLMKMSAARAIQQQAVAEEEVDGVDLELRL